MAIPTDGIATTTRLRGSNAKAIVCFVQRHIGGWAMIRGVKIVSIPVKDQDAALKFYTEKLGFKVATDQEMGPGQQRWIELMIPGADTRLALFTPEGHESRVGGFQAMTFWTDDVFATAEQLKKKGVTLAAEPKKEIWGTMAKFKDPDGNEFVFSGR
jgi:catechol 2,3-dioxygenase-like lactoylglutathione lyase family enzyme